MKNCVIQKLFESFEKANINYIHFKSNSNLDDSFAGQADFDVLVDKNRILDIESIILGLNGKRHNPVHIGSYPGVDNWLMFNESDGIIYHLHLHYQLATGKSLVKDYIIPWDELLFSSRVKDSHYGIFVTNPNLELLLLAARSVLKSKTFDYLKKLLGLYKFPKAIQHEWDFLYQKSTEEKIIEYINELFPHYSQIFKDVLLKQEFSYIDYIKLHKAVRSEMKLYRRYNGIESTLRSWLYRFLDIASKIWSRKMGGYSLTKKTSLQGGLIIAFVGVDGAGKSTVSNDICRWIGRKIECRRFYMGTGDGKTTILASFLKKLNLKSEPIKNGKKTSQVVPLSESAENDVLVFRKRPFLYLKKILKVFLILDVEKNNVRKIKKMQQYRLNGGISVLDRYPQIEISGQNDGPKISGYSKLLGNRFVKKMENREEKCLSIVKCIKPDIVFRLNITAETGLRRKMEHNDLAFHQRKIKELKKLHYQGAHIIEVDAEQPYEMEILDIKRLLWKYI